MSTGRDCCISRSKLISNDFKPWAIKKLFELLELIAVEVVLVLLQLLTSKEDEDVEDVEIDGVEGELGEAIFEFLEYPLSSCLFF